MSGGLQKMRHLFYRVPWWIYILIGVATVVFVDSYARVVGHLTVTTYLVNLAGVALIIAWAYPMAYATSPNYYGPGFLSGILMSIIALGIGVLFFQDDLTLAKGVGCLLGTISVILFTADKQVQRDEANEARWLKRLHSFPKWSWLIIGATPAAFIPVYPWWGFVLVGALTTTLLGFYARLVNSAWKAYKVNLCSVALITAWAYPMAYIRAPTFFQAGLIFMIVAAVFRIFVGIILLKNRFTRVTGTACILAFISSFLLM
jgi:hypothetical protein